MFQRPDVLWHDAGQNPMARETSVALSLEDLGARPRKHVHYTVTAFRRSARNLVGASRHIVASAVNTQLTDLAPQGVGVKLQNSSGALWPVNHPARSIERSEDVIAFHLLEA